MLSDTIIEAPAWEAVDLGDLSERAAKATLRHLGLAEEGYLIVVLGCDDTRIATLNADFRGKPQPTNVLSWPSDDRDPQTPPPPGDQNDPVELGDIAIAFETTMAEARESKKTDADHVTHLIVHAILHLLGYDHEEDDAAALMEATEVAILATQGIADPYQSA